MVILIPTLPLRDRRFSLASLKGRVIWRSWKIDIGPLPNILPSVKGMCAFQLGLYNSLRVRAFPQQVLVKSCPRVSCCLVAVENEVATELRALLLGFQQVRVEAQRPPTSSMATEHVHVRDTGINKHELHMALLYPI